MKCVAEAIYRKIGEQIFIILFKDSVYQMDNEKYILKIYR